MLFSSTIDEMKPDISYLLNEAIMNNISKIIVEGRDDIQFYENLAENINKDIEVLAIENISGYSEGCSSVIDFIKDLSDIIGGEEQDYGYILGIIDRDCRYYRQEIPFGLDDLLLVLNFYSYESHFFSKNTITMVINHLTYASIKLLQNNICIEFIERKILRKIDELYYCSLEALKNACEENYQNVLGYGTKYNKIFNPQKLLISQVLSKKTDLDEYARQKSISKDDIKLIANGKWLLSWFTHQLLSEIDKLPNLCCNNSTNINQCQYCKTEKNDKCLYRSKTTINTSDNKYLQDLENFIIALYDEPALDYIKERIQSLH
ncbi:MAG: hypothetical protein ACK6A9_09635 [Dolichospermum sp.]|jgi:hypothetical protein